MSLPIKSARISACLSATSLGTSPLKTASAVNVVICVSPSTSDDTGVRVTLSKLSYPNSSKRVLSSSSMELESKEPLLTIVKGDKAALTVSGAVGETVGLAVGSSEENDGILVGETVGAALVVGADDGASEGKPVGFADTVGLFVGEKLDVGFIEGVLEGMLEGGSDCVMVGFEVGKKLGSIEGAEVGSIEGASDGKSLGLTVGLSVGEAEEVGDSVSLSRPPCTMTRVWSSKKELKRNFIVKSVQLFVHRDENGTVDISFNNKKDNENETRRSIQSKELCIHELKKYTPKMKMFPTMGSWPIFAAPAKEGAGHGTQHQR